MGIPQFLSDDTAIQNLLASEVKDTDWTTLIQSANYWTVIVPQAHKQAASKIFRSFIQRGYTPAQIALWDSGAEFETNMGVGEALNLGQGVAKIAKDILERFAVYEKILPTVLLTINGVWQAPGDVPGTVVAGQLTTVEGRHAHLAPGSDFHDCDGLILVNHP
jgi:hypothetical protein